jgi:hypothetical protein
MKMTRLLKSLSLMSVTMTPSALAQDNGGIDTQGLPGQPSSVSSGSYGAGFYGPGLTGPGSYGAGTYGRGSYGPGVGAPTGPTTPFTYFSQGGAAAGTISVPSARSR